MIPREYSKSSRVYIYIERYDCINFTYVAPGDGKINIDTSYERDYIVNDLRFTM